MSHHVRVVTWNAEGMFVAGSRTKRATPHDGVAVIKKLNADIVFIPEFGDTGQVDEVIVTALHALGYEVVIYSYGQEELGLYGAALCTRLPLVRHTLHRFTNTKRRFIEAVIQLGTGHLRVIGLHLDDRSEELRLQQVPEVASVVDKDSVVPTIVLGDFNAMHEEARFAKLARTRLLRSAAERFPHEKLQSVGLRVSEMAIGSTLRQMIASTGLHDLDVVQHKTISAKQVGLEWMPSVRLAKIDWILGSRGVTASSYRVLRDVGSDHRPVLTEVDIDTQ